MSSNKVALCDARGPLNDLNDKLAGNDGRVWLDGLKRFLRHENPWPRVGTAIDPGGNWPENPDIVYLRFTSKGRTPEEWFRRMEDGGVGTGSFLMPDHFETTEGKDYVIVILLGSLWDDAPRTTRNILATAEIRGLKRLCPEAALLTTDGIGGGDIRNMGARRIVSLGDPFGDSRRALSCTLKFHGHDERHWDAPACQVLDFRWERSACFAFQMS